MLSEAERAGTRDAALSGHGIAHQPYMRDYEAQSVFRTLRQKIRVLLSESATVAVCATAPQEGASWAAAMLACATAEEGGSVVLVDGDSQKPTQQATFDLTGDRIRRTSSSLEAGFELYTTSSQQIHILSPSGVAGYSERESAISLRSALSSMRSQWGNIIVDCPPISASGLLMEIAPSIDGVIVVVKAERERRDDLKQKIDWLKRMGPPVLGIVLNKPKAHLPRFLERAL
jgi:Mrp family chromosome partitioning ATPase